MYWLGMALIGMVVLVLGFYPIMMGVFAWLLVVDSLHRDAREEWRGLWQGKADAVVIGVRTRCKLRERAADGRRPRYTVTEVPCDRADAEVARRPGVAQKLGPVRVVMLDLTTEDGQRVSAESYSGILRLAEPVEPGTRLRVSYDRQNPAKEPRAARGVGALVALTLYYAAWLLAAFAILRTLRRSVSSLWARLRGGTLAW